jgi:hypothetical protein
MLPFVWTCLFGMRSHEKGMYMKLFRRHTLAREITVILLVKLVLLFGLWYGFVRNAPERHIDDSGVSQRILGGAATTPLSR